MEMTNPKRGTPGLGKATGKAAGGTTEKKALESAAKSKRAAAAPSRAKRRGTPSAIKTQRARRDAGLQTLRPTRGKVTILTAPKLTRFDWLLHGFSTRAGGVSPVYGGQALNLGLTAEDTQENVERNRERFLRALGIAAIHAWPVVRLHQIHSAVIHRIDGHMIDGMAGAQPLQGDGLITNTPGILLAVRTADCLPVVIADPEHRAAGIFHAGWRGTVQRIVQKGVGEMQRQFGSDPAKLQAAIGPGIGGCCYEIGEEVEREFESQFTYWRELIEEVFDSHSLHARYPLLFLNQRAPGHGDPALAHHLNLAKANRLQLRDAGVPEKNVTSLDLCTSCRTDLFFSYRKERVTGRMMAVVGIRP